MIKAQVWVPAAMTLGASAAANADPGAVAGAGAMAAEGEGASASKMSAAAPEQHLSPTSAIQQIRPQLHVACDAQAAAGP